MKAREKINKEIDIIKTREKLIEISSEITRMLKKHPRLCEEQYRPIIVRWCKTIPIENDVKYIWEFFNAIKGLSDNSQSEK